MRLRHLPWLVILCLPCVVLVSGMTTARRQELKEEVRGMFKHGYEGYMRYAYPADELRPLACAPLHRDPDPSNHGVNDIHANISMTLIDVLSSLPLILPSAFPSAIEEVVSRVSFDQDVKIQVFELTIRAMGSLLSTYQYLDRLPDDPSAQARVLGIAEQGMVEVKRHKGKILSLAWDLGKRLLPAFDTPTGLPYARINLRKGVDKSENPETCTAGAGSLVLEFAVLSRLTGDDRFESLAKKAYLALWARRSPHNLLGNTIGVSHGHWLVPGLSGVNAGMDSYFEYGIKAAILLGEDAFLDIFQDSYAAIQTHVRTPDGFIYRPTQFRSLQVPVPSTIDSLSAFLPGMQVLAGDIESAIKSHLVYWNLWRRYSAIPESWAWEEKRLEWNGWPGRPEFIESTYYLYKATKDTFYLRVGERMLTDMKRRTMTSCGFATMKDVDTGALEDRMESFVLSETLKYLYLLFDDTPQDHGSNQVFTTEGHALSLPQTLLRTSPLGHRIPRRGENQFCPVYAPPMIGGGLVVGIERRQDYDYARSLIYGWGVDSRAEEDGQVHWYESGFCQIPQVPKFYVDIVLSPLDASDPAAVPAEDLTPSPDKVRQEPVTGNWVITDVSGLRLSTRWRLDNKGYEVARIGPHRVYSGQQVVVTDPKMEGYLPVPTVSQTPTSHRPAEVMLRFLTPGAKNEQILHAIGATATFGRDFGSTGPERWGLGGEGITLVRPFSGNYGGCQPIVRSKLRPKVKTKGDFVLLLDRGGCTFLDKLINAHEAGAVGVLMVEHSLEGILEQPGQGQEQLTLDEGVLIRPSADGTDEEVLKKVEGTGMVFTAKLVGDMIKRLIEVEKKVVKVEIRSLDGAMVTPSSYPESTGGNSFSSGAGGETGKLRVGRLALGEYEIHNLRIVERLP